jgi:hypothetical protein
MAKKPKTDTFSREYDPGIEVEFEVEYTLSGRYVKASWDGPSEAPELEIDRITCEGREVNIDMTEQELDVMFNDIMDMRADERAAKEEDAYDAWRDEQRDGNV